MMRNRSSLKHARSVDGQLELKIRIHKKRKAASLRESPEEKPLKDDDFSQRAITKDETQAETTKSLDPLDMAPGVNVIKENYEISINFVNT